MDKTINLFIAGDLYTGNRTERLIQEEKYKEIFNDVLPFIQGSDLSIVNLESPLIEAGKPIAKIGLAIVSSPKTIHALKFAGFNLLALANNHIMDYGTEGLQNTINICKQNSIDYVGAGLNLNEASKPVYKKIKGKMIGILNLTENEFTVTQGDYPGANPLDPVANYQKIADTKSNADYVLVIYHGGNENYCLPSPRIKKLFRFFVEAGADTVISHHTHSYSGYEVYNGKPIFYGLGNFLFDKPGKFKIAWNYGYAVGISINDTVSFNLIPVELCNENPDVKLMTGDDKQIFNNKVEELNSIISDDRLLSSEFNDYCLKVKRLYMAGLEPHSINILNFLRNRKLFPSLLSRNKKILYLNFIRCESHRDVLINLLENTNAM